MDRGAVRRTLALAASLCALAPACSVLIDPSTYPRDGRALPPGTVDRCGLGFAAEDACGDCAGSRCCPEAEACAGSSECAALLDCIGGCSVEDAPAGCLGACRPGGADPDAASLFACLTRACPDDCGPCGAAPIAGSAECATCVAQSAAVCEGYAGCAADEACGEHLLCRLACEDPGCIAGCDRAAPDGGARLAGYHVVVDDVCHAACGRGGSWACAGAYSWGGADASGRLAVHLQLTRFVGGTAGGGVRASACAGHDVACAAPLTTGVTGADGGVTLTLDLGAGDPGFTGYFQLVSEEPAPPLVPTVFDPGRRVVADSTFVVTVATPAEVVLMAAGATGGAVDPERALLLTTVLDCEGSQAAGVALSLDGAQGPGVGPIYLREVLFDAQATETDGSGTGGFVDVPAPAEGAHVDLIGATEADGDVARAHTVIRAGTLTYVFLQPRT